MNKECAFCSGESVIGEKDDYDGIEVRIIHNVLQMKSYEGWRNSQDNQWHKKYVAEEHIEIWFCPICGKELKECM